MDELRTKPTKDKNGYELVKKPEWWTADVGAYVFSHQACWAQWYGVTEVPASFIIHHKDEDRTNNAASNLELLTRAEHNREHKTRYSEITRLVICAMLEAGQSQRSVERALDIPRTTIRRLSK